MGEQNNLNVKDNLQQLNSEKGFSKFDITLRDIVCSLILLLSSIFLSAFGVFGGFRGGFTVTAVIQTLIMTVFLMGRGYKFKVFSFICLVLGLGVSANFLITSNSAVRFWSFAVFMGLTVVWLTSIVRNEEKKGDINFFYFIFSPAVAETIINIPATVVSFLDKNKKGNKTLGKSLLGILLSIPVLIVTVPLLMNSDEAFSGMISMVFEKTATIIARTVFGAVIGIFAVSYILSLKKGKQLVENNVVFSGVEPAIIISFLSVLSVTYLSYLFSQLAYFFDAFRGFLPKGYEFTVAAYARRGFFEMTVIAVINFIVIFLCRLLCDRKNKRAVTAINVLCTFIGGFTLIIIATALSKMVLYISSFGMTKLRITTSVFMIFLAVVFVALIVRLYTSKVNILKTALITSAVALILLGSFNVNTVVAKYNYTAYERGILESIDVETVAELGDEGIPYLIMLTDDENSGVSDYAMYKLSLAYEDYYSFKYDETYNSYEIQEKIYTEWGQMSIPRVRAYKQLEDYMERNPYILDYQNEYIQIQNTDEYGLW